MSGNTFGKIFKVTTFGESHGEALGVIIDGLPAGTKISLEKVLKNECSVLDFRFEWILHPKKIRAILNLRGCRQCKRGARDFGRDLRCANEFLRRIFGRLP